MSLLFRTLDNGGDRVQRPNFSCSIMKFRPFYLFLADTSYIAFDSAGLHQYHYVT